MTAKKKSSRGKPMNLYMCAEDVTKLRELTAYAASNGLRTSDRMIVRAALHIVGKNRLFLYALKDVEAGD